MPGRTIKMALAATLEDLTRLNYEKFCHQLLDRRKDPRVRRSRVEGKTLFEVVDVLVSTFTESGALQVTVELLKEIGCNEEAQALVRETTGGR